MTSPLRMSEGPSASRIDDLGGLGNNTGSGGNIRDLLTRC